MLSTGSEFDAGHALLNKSPIYMVEFAPRLPTVSPISDPTFQLTTSDSDFTYWTEAGGRDWGSGYGETGAGIRLGEGGTTNGTRANHDGEFAYFAAEKGDTLSFSCRANRNHVHAFNYSYAGYPKFTAESYDSDTALLGKQTLDMTPAPVVDTWGDVSGDIVLSFTGTVKVRVGFQMYNQAYPTVYVYLDDFNVTGSGEFYRFGSYQYVTGNVRDVLEVTDYKKYLSTISGGSQIVTPERGSASVSGYTVTILDVNNEITDLIALDSANGQNMQAIIKVGYRDVVEAQFLTVFTGWVSGLKQSADKTSWQFTITDPAKKLQKHIGWDATDEAPAEFVGNPMDILLRILTSTGTAASNGPYDVYSAANGCAIDQDQVDVAGIEAIRDRWFPGTSYKLDFELTSHIKAKAFIEEEILKLLNCYPRVDGEGRYSIIAFKPQLSIFNTTDVQSFNEDNIIDWKFDLNFPGLINEVEFKFDHDGDDFDTIVHYADADSINYRGIGKAPLVIESTGLKETVNPAAAEIVDGRANRVFSRFATPPVKIVLKTFFYGILSEAGDIVTVTHSKIPDISTGTIGITARSMEIIKRVINWVTGVVTIDLIDSAFITPSYGVISPMMTITSVASSTVFSVSFADAAKFEDFDTPYVAICESSGRTNRNVEIVSIASTTVTVDPATEPPPEVGWTVRFSRYDLCTEEQIEDRVYIADDTPALGPDDDDPDLISP